MKFKNFMNESKVYVEVEPQDLGYNVSFFKKNEEGDSVFGWDVYLTSKDAKEIFGKLFSKKTKVDVDDETVKKIKAKA